MGKNIVYYVLSASRNLSKTSYESKKGGPEGTKDMRMSSYIKWPNTTKTFQ